MTPKEIGTTKVTGAVLFSWLLTSIKDGDRTAYVVTPFVASVVLLTAGSFASQRLLDRAIRDKQGGQKGSWRRAPFLSPGKFWLGRARRDGLGGPGGPGT
jgi:hypothetical protein